MKARKRQLSVFAPDRMAGASARAGARWRHGHGGFTILEMMLAVAAMGVALLFVIHLMNMNQYRNAGRDSAEQMGHFQQVAENYFYANRAGILAATAATVATDANVQAHCVIRVPNAGAAIAPGNTAGQAGSNGTLAWSVTRNTCSFDASMLSAKGLWPGGSLTAQGHDADMGGDWRYTAVFRRSRLPGPDGLMGTADDAWGDDAEMLVVRADTDSTLQAINTDAMRKDDQRMQNLLSQRMTAGPAGGLIPVGDLTWCRAARTGVVQVCGTGWTMDLSNFVDATAMTTLQAALPPS